MIPFISHATAGLTRVAKTVEYANGQKLDIWLPDNPVNAPVMMFVPGGGWVLGHRRGQGHQLMSHLVDQGWICVSIDYRTAPLNRWPAPYQDVQAAWRWVLGNIHDFGASDDFMAVAGASAGGHLASLLALTDTSFARPDALVSLYGVYSWVDKSWDHWLINQFVKNVVADKKALRAASPILKVHRNAPPTLLVHGTADFVTPFSGAKKFWAALDDVSVNPVWLHKIPGGHHAFDLIDSRQAKAAIDVIDDFLTTSYSEMAA
ncbi:alpha/beta hydrolase [Mycobacterium sp. CnD-18-1]|uniref:alpha/beta hydrolase n=1 Tax=Mycobacterium sp. CnD-18-1 TaxID=2917744 RepID=UPI001EF35F7D|nr:alpha/beta hydrolase [Mycobacterium sp. CnD-18-1]MCG7607184.1 alpha/beta hydrolase [Mycobacterium sp. CnD-18-1]